MIDSETYSPCFLDLALIGMPWTTTHRCLGLGPGAQAGDVTLLFSLLSRGLDKWLCLGTCLDPRTRSAAAEVKATVGSD